MGHTQLCKRLNDNDFVVDLPHVVGISKTSNVADFHPYREYEGLMYLDRAEEQANNLTSSLTRVEGNDAGRSGSNQAQKVIYAESNSKRP